jgi:hypothetical protein
MLTEVVLAGAVTVSSTPHAVPGDQFWVVMTGGAVVVVVVGPVVVVLPPGVLVVVVDDVVVVAGALIVVLVRFVCGLALHETLNEPAAVSV